MFSAPVLSLAHCLPATQYCDAPVTGVIVAIGVDEAVDAAYSGAFEMVIIGHKFSEAEKNMIATAARHAGAKVLCMYSETQPPEVQAAMEFIHNLDGPERLVFAVAELLHKASA